MSRISTLKLLRVNFKNSFQKSTAYFSQNWTNLFSTVGYTLTQIALIELLFGNITQLGGFSKDEILLLMFFGQINFYVIATFSFFPAQSFIEAIAEGGMDLIFTKPVPPVLHIFSNNTEYIGAIRDALPAILPVLILINWSSLSFTLLHVLIGILVLCMGLILNHVIIFVASSVSFWTGSGSNILLTYFWSQAIEPKFVLEKTAYIFRLLLLLFLPSLIVSAVSVSVMLGKSHAIFWLAAVFIVCYLGCMFARFVWRRALREYSSASS